MIAAKTMRIGSLFASLILVSLLGCAAPCALERIETAIVEPEVVEEAVAVEKELDSREGAALPDGKNWFEIRHGTAPIVITATHSTRPLRDGKRRFSDGGGTAALALAIGKMTGATVLYTTYEGPSDPNMSEDDAFKRALEDILRRGSTTLVLDVHGSHPFRSYDVDLGTRCGASLFGRQDFLEELILQLNREGIKSISANRFRAMGRGTITAFANRHGVPAIQLEINATWLRPSASDLHAQRFSLMCQALVRYVRTVCSSRLRSSA
jgi:hypothetical protein